MSGHLPLFILAGSDEGGIQAANARAGGGMLEGHKGAMRVPGGRPLVAEVVQRFRASGRFQDPVVVGPARIYAQLGLDCEVLDCEGDLSRTLARTGAAIRQRFEGERPVAVSACDILPTADELNRLLDRDYEPHRECVFWSQLARAKAKCMGSSSWKLGYRFAGEHDATYNLYPGHLAIIRPAGLRFDLAARLLHLAYRHRNMPLTRRGVLMTIRGLGALLQADCRNLLRREPSLLALSVPHVCWQAYLAYRHGRLSVNGFESAVMRLFVNRSHRGRNAGRAVVFAVTDILSLAKDLDTRDELLEAARDRVESVKGPRG